MHCNIQNKYFISTSYQKTMEHCGISFLLPGFKPESVESPWWLKLFKNITAKMSKIAHQALENLNNRVSLKMHTISLILIMGAYHSAY